MESSARIATLYCCSALAAFVLLRPSDVTADRASYAPTWCEVWLANSPFQITETGLFNLHSTLNTPFICPVPSDSQDLGDNFAHKRATLLEVSVRDGNDDANGGGVSAQACITWYDGYGGSCGAAYLSSLVGTGFFTLYPSVSVWTSTTTMPEDYPSVYVNVPDTDVGSSGILGYRVESN